MFSGTPPSTTISSSNTQIYVDTSQSTIISGGAYVYIPGGISTGTLINIRDIGGNRQFYSSGNKIQVSTTTGALFTDGNGLKSIQIPYGNMTIQSVRSNAWQVLYMDSMSQLSTQTLASVDIISSLTSQNTRIESNMTVNNNIQSSGNIEVISTITIGSGTALTQTSISNTFSTLDTSYGYVTMANLQSTMQSLSNIGSNGYITSSIVTQSYLNMGTTFGYISTTGLSNAIINAGSVYGYISSFKDVQRELIYPSTFIYSLNGNIQSSSDFGLSNGYGSLNASISPSINLSGMMEGMVFDTSGNLYIANTNYNNIYKVSTNGVSSVFAGSVSGVSGYINAIGTSARFNAPRGLAIDASNNLYVADSLNYYIRIINLNTASVSTFAGNGANSITYNGSLYSGVDTPRGLAYNSNMNTIYFTFRSGIGILNCATAILSIFSGNISGATGYTSDNISSTSTLFNNPRGICVSSRGIVFVADSSNNVIRILNTSGVVIQTIGVGTGYLDGPASIVKLNTPIGIGVSYADVVYFTDSANNCIRKLQMISGVWMVRTICGINQSGNVNGDWLASRFYQPSAILVTSSNLYVADQGNSNIRTVSSGYGNPMLNINTMLSVSTLVGNGNMTASFYGNAPMGLVQLSDSRLKDNIETLTSSIYNLSKLEGVYYRMNTGGKRRIGYIAQDVESIYPEIVFTDVRNDYKSISYDSLTAPLVEAVKELTQRMNELKSMLDKKDL